ncbi:MAG TPA: DMT family transporter [Xanthobacteraceae bacterium]|nr:DMT family transporter [Xanthobacteraceae bacterium]
MNVEGDEPGGRKVSLRARLAAARPAPTTVGILCGAGAALFWAAGFVAARHGIAIGYSPADLAVHRFAWAGFFLLPLLWRDGIGNFGGVGWGRAVLLTLAGGPPLAIISYSGFLLVPLGHGGVIQPSSAALSGLFYASAVLKEKVMRERVIGAAVIVVGLCVIGLEAVSTIGHHGLLGDFAFVAAGFCFATFAMLVKLWRIPATRATVVVSVMSLADIPIHWALFGFERMISFGLWENLIQALAQGALAGAGAIYLFARAVILLGAGRAAVFTSLVPGFTLLIGFLLLGEVPSLAQLAGLAIVLIGFRLTQRPG